LQERIYCLLCGSATPMIADSVISVFHPYL